MEELKHLSYDLMYNLPQIQGDGLFYGKTGSSLALFAASRYLNDSKLEDIAYDLIQKMLIKNYSDYGIINGLSGIGYALAFLINNKYIDGDFNDLFKEKAETIINSYLSIDEKSNLIISSIPILYLFKSMQDAGYRDERIPIITKKILEGVEVFLSLQFYDWCELDYVGNKSYIISIFEEYLKVILYLKLSPSKYIMKSYFALYRDNKIISSAYIGLYMKEIGDDSNEDMENVLKENIYRGLLSCKLEYCSLYEYIKTKQLVDNIKNSGLISKQEYEKFNKIIPNIYLKTKKDNKYSYESGLARYILFITNNELI